jgi:hypothetical protein
MACVRFDMAGFHRFGQARAQSQRRDTLPGCRDVIFCAFKRFDRHVSDIGEILCPQFRIGILKNEQIKLYDPFYARFFAALQIDTKAFEKVAKTPQSWARN